MKSAKIQELTHLIKSQKGVVLAYLFGSQVSGDTGPMSDYDIAIYADGLDASQLFNLRLELAGKLSRLLGTDNIDLVILNQIDAPALSYDIIKNGILLFDQSNYRMIVEPKILNQFFDFHSLLVRHQLTKAAA